MKQDRFPLVSDDEIMLTKMPVMDLYDESDFISNIKGDYHDKNYLEWSPINEEQAVTPSVASKEPKPGPEPKKVEKTYAELAREEARADLKKKRSAKYLTQDVSHTRRHNGSTLVRQGNLSLIHILGGVESLITYPTTQTHADIPAEVRHSYGLTDDLLRLSIGIEDARDLIADLRQALEG